LYPPSPLPLGNPGGCFSKKIFLTFVENYSKRLGKHLVWQEDWGQGTEKKNWVD
jgi:hypothetical protein